MPIEMTKKAYPSMEHARAGLAKRASPRFDQDVKILLEMVGAQSIERLTPQGACTLVWLAGWDHTTMDGLRDLFLRVRNLGFDEGVSK